jgi:MFS family permease
MTDALRVMSKRLQGIYYGWYVAAAAFVIMTICSGLGFYNLGVYMTAFSDEQGFPISLASLGTATVFLSGGLFGLVVGRLIERFDIRWCISSGAIVLSLVLYGAQFVTDVWSLLIFHAMLGVSYCATALIPCTTIVARWFDKQRSIALAYASTGLSLGGILLTPPTVALIEQGGIAFATQSLAFLPALVVVPIALLVLRQEPASLGLYPDGAAGPAERPPEKNGAADEGSYRSAARSRFFVLLTITFVLIMMAQVGLIAHQFRLISLRTGDASAASFAVALLAGCSIGGRLIGGWLLTFVADRVFVLSLIAGQACAALLFGFGQSIWVLYIATVIFGLTVGNLLMMQPLLIASSFGLAAYGRLYSVSQFAVSFGLAAGPALMGFVFDASGSYAMACFTLAGVCASAFAVFYIADRTRNR